MDDVALSKSFQVIVSKRIFKFFFGNTKAYFAKNYSPGFVIHEGSFPAENLFHVGRSDSEKRFH